MTCCSCLFRASLLIFSILSKVLNFVCTASILAWILAFCELCFWRKDPWSTLCHYQSLFWFILVPILQMIILSIVDGKTQEVRKYEKLGSENYKSDEHLEHYSEAAKRANKPSFYNSLGSSLSDQLSLAEKHSNALKMFGCYMLFAMLLVSSEFWEGQYRFGLAASKVIGLGGGSGSGFLGGGAATTGGVAYGGGGSGHGGFGATMHTTGAGSWGVASTSMGSNPEFRFTSLGDLQRQISTKSRELFERAHDKRFALMFVNTLGSRRLIPTGSSAGASAGADVFFSSSLVLRRFTANLCLDAWGWSYTRSLASVINGEANEFGQFLYTFFLYFKVGYFLLSFLFMWISFSRNCCCIGRYRGKLNSRLEDLDACEGKFLSPHVVQAQQMQGQQMRGQQAVVQGQPMQGQKLLQGQQQCPQGDFHLANQQANVPLESQELQRQETPSIHYPAAGNDLASYVDPKPAIRGGRNSSCGQRP